MSFAKIEHAVTAIRSGEFVVVVDDAGRENEGDLIISAQCATPEATGFMVRYTSGVICVARTAAALAACQAAFRERRVAKRYLALLHGAPRADVLEHAGAIGRHPKDFRRLERADLSSHGVAAP